MIITIALSLVFVFQRISKFSNWIESILAGFIRIFNCATEGMFAVYVEELYPTTVRSSGVGLQSAIGLIGSSIAPYILNYSSYIGLNALSVMGIIGIPTLLTVKYLE